MKKYILNQLIVCILLVLFISCTAPSYYYQKISLEQSTNNSNTTNNLDIAFNFWTQGGSSSIYITNNSDKTVYIDLGNSHFIQNGYANTYFQNSISSTSNTVTKGNAVVRSSLNSSSSTRYSGSTNGSSTTLTNSYNNTIVQQRVMAIPPNSTKRVDGFKMQPSVYTDCDLSLYPRGKDSSSVVFTPEKTPFEFRYFVSYGYSEHDLGSYSFIEKSFWVKNIVNYNSSDFYKYTRTVKCGKSSSGYTYYYPYQDNNSYYLRYSRTPSSR